MTVDDFAIPDIRPAVMPEEEFWNSRPVLQHVRTFARSRLAGPWSTLGVVLALAASSTEPTVQLPPIVGGKASLNLFVLLTGRSGAGKGTSEAAAMDAIEFRDSRAILPIQTDVLPVGSGEGIARFFRKPDDPDADSDPDIKTRAVFSVPEIDTLADLGARTGSTTMTELRKVYSGETLGFLNSAKERTNIVPKHSYRLSLVVGGQPAKCRPLLDDADGGTPQRFVWLPVTDPEAPDVEPPEPPQLVIEVPRFNVRDFDAIPVCATARDQIVTQRRRTLRGENVDPLDGHKYLCQLKVAAALMILDERTEVNDEDWVLADRIMHESTSTREHVQSELSRTKRSENHLRAVAEAERAKTVQGQRENDERRRVRQAVIRKLGRESGPVRVRDLAKNLPQELRHYIDDELAGLADSGELRLVKDGRADACELS